MENKRFFIVYYSSKSNNTHRFMLKLNCKCLRLPIEQKDEPDEILESKIPTVNHPFILLTPTYAGGLGKLKGAVPKPVKKFLNNPVNRNNCKAVIASGNTNFNDTYCIAGDIISQKLQIPFLYKFELLGTNSDVENVIKIGNEFWEKNNF
ncbi:class Ib ribonucleoside-diphosphate reductase assembly flavoprotein NrdI [Malacoplasma penetrans]|uniref:Protein NrdI n=1 Tax=Malacoplasma penetrans (strain HF-2) TaxID=272633 RepID=NRDI_MALP2|nr:class Ib ribonucleoside-diphosphate reductase assembly flavoprotein NrdI [Malacoplasma penetrans]Q8EWW3.1 RecName: Full=Protein NrdI [Malacoplasma penetrans HF-2]RXY97336.1 class Ib ribonucleoside-diphosphate reductase assembly flavoprotein NrdI [Malacoplasma penetrans]BAC43877.1 ribonucleotide reductase [Malacoplasma penetrans HF-2]